MRYNNENKIWSDRMKSNDNTKKVGICTLYFRNQNYGANLQSYSLVSIIEALGYHAEIVSYNDDSWLNTILFPLIQSTRLFINGLMPIITRNEAVARFRNTIPHSKLYYKNTIHKATAKYDSFIVGSDQVWNPDWINQYLSLEFTNRKKPTSAYAASIGKISLTLEQKERLEAAVNNTDIISLREKESIPALAELTDKPIEYVLDPTLLLSKDKWNVVSSERIIEENYMFCYFLGNNENLRNVASQYAKQKKLKIVTLPYLNGAYRKVDDGFGDYALFDVSPKDFISLIKYASFVMTDSFHGAVFSHLFERSFVVSGSIDSQMGCRLLSLTELFGTKERYFEDHQLVTLEALTYLDGVSLNLDWKQYERMRQRSLLFLEKVLRQ